MGRMRRPGHLHLQYFILSKYIWKKLNCNPSFFKRHNFTSLNLAHPSCKAPNGLNRFCFLAGQKVTGPIGVFRGRREVELQQEGWQKHLLNCFLPQNISLWDLTHMDVQE